MIVSALIAATVIGALPAFVSRLTRDPHSYQTPTS